MKTSPTLLITSMAIVAAAFLQHRGYADDQPTPTAAPAATAEVTGPPTPAATPTQPVRPARTFAYAAEVLALIGEGKTGAATIAGPECETRIHSDGTFTDVTHPERPVAYDQAGTELDIASYKDPKTAPLSVQYTIAVLEKATAASDEDAG